MTKNLLNLKNILVIALLLSGSAFFAQNKDQGRFFINRTHVGIAKIEKEMYYGNNNTYEADLKKAIKYQLIAVKYLKDNDYANAVAYSFKSRAIVVDICTKMNIAEGQAYNLNDDEKAYCDPSKYTNLKFKADMLSAEQTKTVDELNLLDPAKFHELELGTLRS
jgi:hypothetical protein